MSTDPDKTPVPEPAPDFPQLTLSELNALVRRLLERVKVLEQQKIIDTINEHEDRLDTHEERFDSLDVTLKDLKRESDVGALWRTAIEKKVVDTLAGVNRIEALLSK